MTNPMIHPIEFEGGWSETQLRLRCLELAADLSDQSETASVTLMRASQFYVWVTGD